MYIRVGIFIISLNDTFEYVLFVLMVDFFDDRLLGNSLEALRYVRIGESIISLNGSFE